MPQDGEIVVVEAGKSIYLDTQTAILKALILQGGSLIFDDSQDVHLRAEYIIIADGGRLQVGSQQAPFNHKATITIHGSSVSTELPIYGAKVMAVRNGSVEMFGTPSVRTWTHLAQTSLANSTQITLENEVDWPIGRKIVIASTGDLNSIDESEVRFIVNKTDDNKTLILDRPLKYAHYSERKSFGNDTIELKAEVGLFTHNIKFEGYFDSSWNNFYRASKCPNYEESTFGSEFDMQTCFINGNRSDSEDVGDMFGAIIRVYPGPVSSKSDAVFRASNVEFYHMGQSNRV